MTMGGVISTLQKPISIPKLVVFGVGAIILGFASGSDLFIVSGGFVALALFASFVFLPPIWQWPMLLMVASLIPLGNIPVPNILRTVSPWGLMVAVMLVQRYRIMRICRVGTKSERTGLAWLSTALLGWFILSTILGSAPYTSLGWLTSIVTLVLVPVLVVVLGRDDLRSLVVAWVVLGGVLGFYALFEAYVFRQNPVGSVLHYEGLRQTWGAYRATTTLGHPLMNGMYFSVGFAMALGFFALGRSLVFSGLAVLNLGGVVASGARTAAIACGVVAATVVLYSTSTSLKRREPAWRAAAMAASLVLAGGISVSFLSARADSHEAAQSEAFRSAQVPVAFERAAEGSLLGVGPGMASESNVAILHTKGGSGAFESLWLEALVGTGYVGLVLLSAFLGVLLVMMVRRRQFIAFLALVAWLINATTVNAFEGSRSEQIFVGLLLALCFTPVSLHSALSARVQAPGPERAA